MQILFVWGLPQQNENPEKRNKLGNEFENFVYFVGLKWVFGLNKNFFFILHDFFYDLYASILSLLLHLEFFSVLSENWL